MESERQTKQNRLPMQTTRDVLHMIRCSLIKRYIYIVLNLPRDKL